MHSLNRSSFVDNVYNMHNMHPSSYNLATNVVYMVISKAIEAKLDIFNDSKQSPSTAIRKNDICFQHLQHTKLSIRVFLHKIKFQKINVQINDNDVEDDDDDDV